MTEFLYGQQTGRKTQFISYHVLDDFDCGVTDLNQFLIKYALQNQSANSANTYVACENG
ncbi:hypothetical protein [sulfur-oxidizing endosymbiont of Gigantopelta aegis]|uniref:hypothetical protein n=1 Tax=sulfur-oxidizing endosymbiont of Gigantopelta aegis TaxID=2794934 RepID=UPI0031B5BA90